MAVAYFKAHAPRGFWPILNGGEKAVFYYFFFLYVAARWSGSDAAGLCAPEAQKERRCLKSATAPLRFSRAGPSARMVTVNVPRQNGYGDATESVHGCRRASGSLVAGPPRGCDRSSARIAVRVIWHVCLCTSVPESGHKASESQPGVARNQ